MWDWEIGVEVFCHSFTAPAVIEVQNGEIYMFAAYMGLAALNLELWYRIFVYFSPFWLLFEYETVKYHGGEYTAGRAA